MLTGLNPFTYVISSSNVGSQVDQAIQIWHAIVFHSIHKRRHPRCLQNISKYTLSTEVITNPDIRPIIICVGLITMSKIANFDVCSIYWRYFVA